MKFALVSLTLFLSMLTPIYATADQGLQAVIFDWAGTVQDYGSRAPTACFRQVFAENGISVTEPEVRQFMGLEKREHIQRMLDLPSVQRQWRKTKGSTPTEEDLSDLYAQFIPLQLACLKDYAVLIPGMRETGQWIRDRGWLIGSSTGYSQAMLDVISQAIAKQGFQPDAYVSADMVDAGRPDPAMIHLNCSKLGVNETKRVVKIDDSIPGIVAGNRAGCWTIYVYQTGNGVGKSLEELQSMPEHERQTVLDSARRPGIGVAHYVIPSVAELPDYLATIDHLVKQGYSPDDFSADNPPPQPKPAHAHHDILLFTPGPLTTSATVKQAMLKDYGSRDPRFIEINASVLKRITNLVDHTGEYTTVPVQGSGTFGVEAMIGTFVPKDGKILILSNGVYGKRMERICHLLRRSHHTLTLPEDETIPVNRLERILQKNPQITHIGMVHCETTSGLLNPLEDIAQLAKKYDKILLVDAMSSFGGIPIDTKTAPFDVLVSCSNKCLEGVPGISFAVARKSLLETSAGNSPSLVLDLQDQWAAMEKTRQWRFTPPTHVVVALNRALDELEMEGGVQARHQRYQRNAERLRQHFVKLGFRPFLKKEVQAPVILTFYQPQTPNFSFDHLYNALIEKGYVIYPGKVTDAKTFRIGCIGQIYELDAWDLHHAVAEIVRTPSPR